MFSSFNRHIIFINSNYKFPWLLVCKHCYKKDLTATEKASEEKVQKFKDPPTKRSKPPIVDNSEKVEDQPKIRFNNLRFQDSSEKISNEAKIILPKKPGIDWTRTFRHAGINVNLNENLSGSIYDLKKAIEMIIKKKELDDFQADQVLSDYLDSKKFRLPKEQRNFYQLMLSTVGMQNPKTIEKFWKILKKQSEGKGSLFAIDPNDVNDALPESVDANRVAEQTLPNIPKAQTQIKLILDKWSKFNQVPSDKKTFFEKMHKKGMKNDAWLQETWVKLKNVADRIK